MHRLSIRPWVSPRILHDSRSGEYWALIHFNMGPSNMHVYMFNVQSTVPKDNVKTKFNSIKVNKAHCILHTTCDEEKSK